MIDVGVVVLRWLIFIIVVACEDAFEGEVTRVSRFTVVDGDDTSLHVEGDGGADGGAKTRASKVEAGSTVCPVRLV